VLSALTARASARKRLSRAALPALAARAAARNWRLAGAALLALAAGAPAHAQFNLALSPMRAELNLNGGEQRNGTLTLGNESHDTARFRTEILDISIDKEAVPQFKKDIPEESEYSCRQWLTVNPMEAEIPPQGHMDIRYTFRVPAGVPQRTYHCALGFTSLPGVGKPQDAVGIVAVVRVVGTLYVTVGNPAPSGSVKEISVGRLDGGQATIYRAVVSVENSGLTNLRGSGTAELLNAAGNRVESAAFPSVVILPQRVQPIPIVLNTKLADGEYTYRVRVNLGTGEIQEATYQFRISAPAQ
jgi:hypothetical protein